MPIDEYPEWNTGMHAITLEGAHAVVEDCVMAGCVFGVRASMAGRAEIRRCTFSHTPAGGACIECQSSLPSRLPIHRRPHGGRGGGGESGSALVEV